MARMPVIPRVKPEGKICGRMSSEYGEAVCQSVKGAPLDDLIGKLVLQALTPAALEATLAVATNVEAERASPRVKPEGKP